MRVLVGAALLCLAAAGCGGLESEPNLAKAAERTEAAGSGRFALDGVQSMDGKQVAVTCSGEADYAAKSVRVDCSYAALGKLRAIAIGRTSYVRGDWPPGFATIGKWMKSSGDLDDNSLANLSPERLLALLRAASSETERVGEEDVRGSSTVRYRLTVDCEPAILECDGTVPVEVWIDDDGFVRRISLDDDDGLATFEFFDFGADVDIHAPPADEVVDEDEVFSTESGSSSFGPITCADGEAKPIGQALATRVLRSHGFEMHDVGCLLTNSGGDATDVLAREGLVDCGVHAEPPAGAPKTVTRRTSGSEDATFVLENLECTIDADGAQAAKQIGRLEAAFEELEHAIRP